MSKKLCLLISFVFVLGLAGSVWAQTRQVSWTDGGGDHLWCNPANWDLGLPFVSDWQDYQVDRPWINIANMTDPVLISADQDCIPEGGHVFIGDTVDTGPGVALNMTGGEARFMELGIGYSIGGVGTMTMSGGHIQLDHYAYVGVGDGGNGTLIMTGGTIDCNGTTWLGSETTWPSAIIVAKNEQGPGTGHLQLDGGTISARRLSINARGTMDITGGKIILRKYSGVWAGLNTQEDIIASLQADIADGNFTAYGGSGVVGIAIMEPEDPCDPNEIWLLGRVDNGTAWNPQPANGAIDIQRDVDLKWSPGDYVKAANGHQLYFSSSFSDVNNRIGSPVTLSDTNYAPGQSQTLVLAETYYWAVDEVNDVCAPFLWPGPVWQFTMDRGVAKEPYPADGEDDVDNNVVLHWTPGVDANTDANGHDVYFGTDRDAVRDANTTVQLGVFMGNYDTNSWDTINYDGNDLELVRTYYWRVDEVNEGTSGSPWKGDVWSFIVEGKAYNVYPPDGAVDIPFLDLSLEWAAGTGSAGHDVYFGSDKTAVTDANTNTVGIYRGPTQPLSDVNWLVPNAEIVIGNTYYWRIDEVNVITATGDVWSFTTGPFLIVDDMDSYYGIAGHEIHETWGDYRVNSTGAQVYLWKSTSDVNFVRDGNSMRFYYRNTIKITKYVGSKAEADTTDLQFGPDWAAGGIKSMTLWFYGDPCNVHDGQDPCEVDQMYVALETIPGSYVVSEYFDMSHIKEASWHQWDIDLEDFNGVVTLSNVTKMYIGFGGYYETGQSSNKGAGYGGFGDTVYFDDIRLYPPRCFPEQAHFTDFTGDCITDYSDFDIMARDWLLSGQWAAASEPDPGPVIWYKLDEGTGSTIVNNDGSYSDPNYNLPIGIDMDGNSDPNNDPCWVDGAPDGNNPLGALDFDGSVDPCATEPPITADGLGDYLVLPALNLNSNTVSIMAWIKPGAGVQGCGNPDDNCSGYTGLVMTRDASTTASGLGYGGQGGGKLGYGWSGYIGYTWNDNASDTWSFSSGLDPNEEEWNFVGVVIEPGKASLYLSDGNSLASIINAIPHDPEEWDGIAFIGRDGQDFTNRAFRGAMDDVRIYDYSLSPGQIMGVAGVEGLVYLPLNSVADLVVGDKDPCYPNVDERIDFRDYGVLTKHWLKEVLWPE